MFIENRIPDTISPGAVGGPEFMTSIKKLRGGGEYRNALWENPLRKYTVAYGARSQERVIDELVAFIYSSHGSLHSFRMRDWSDYTVTDSQITTCDGEAFWFRLTKSYGTHVRRIMKPDPGTVDIMLDGSSVNRDRWIIDSVNGTVIFKAPPRAGRVLSWTGEFDVPVRFGTDAIDVVMHDFRTGSSGAIELQEVRIRESIDTDAYEEIRQYLFDFDQSDLLDMLDILDNHVNNQWGLTQ